MNEKVLRIIVGIIFVLLLITSTVFIWLYVSSNNTADKLAEDYSAVTDKLELKVGELAVERGKRTELDNRYRDLEGRYSELGKTVSSFTEGLSEYQQGLSGVATEIREVGEGLQFDIGELSRLAEEIGRVIEETPKPEHSIDNSSGSGSD